MGEGGELFTSPSAFKRFNWQYQNRGRILKTGKRCIQIFVGKKNKKKENQIKSNMIFETWNEKATRFKTWQWYWAGGGGVRIVKTLLLNTGVEGWAR